MPEGFKAFEIGHYVKCLKNNKDGVVIGKRYRSGILYPQVYLWGDDEGNGDVQDGEVVSDNAGKFVINNDISSAFEDRGTEMFEFVWATYNIRTAHRLITSSRSTTTLTLEDITSLYDHWLKHHDTGAMPIINVRINKEKALSDNVNLDIPLICIKRKYLDDSGKNQTGSLPIDGWHRIYRAYHLQKELKTYLLSIKESEITEY